MINFSEGSVFNLKKVDNDSANKNFQLMMTDGERLIGVYKTVRDQIIFTNMRIVAIDVIGVTGKKQEIHSFPYTNIQYFGVQTPGFLEILPDAELCLHFSNGMEATFEFKGKNDLIEISREIARYALKND